MEPDVLSPGSKVKKYRILRLLGRGGFGVTYLAEREGEEDDLLNRSATVVLKENYPSDFAVRDQLQGTIRPKADPALYDWSLNNFINEARTLSKLHHSNIVPVMEAFKANGTAYYSMPALTGGTLTRLQNPKTPAEADRLLSLLPQLLNALMYIHQQGILHRDIKPDNILLTEDGTPVMIDFGAARQAMASRTMTRIGTPGYAAPEQMAQEGRPDAQSDIYGLGATFYSLITGKAPDDSSDRLMGVALQSADPLTALADNSLLKEKYPLHVLKSIDKALQLKRENRWKSAQEWLQYLTSPEEEKPAPVSQQPAPRAAAPVAEESAPPVRGFFRRVWHHMRVYVPVCCFVGGMAEMYGDDSAFGGMLLLSLMTSILMGVMYRPWVWSILCLCVSVVLAIASNSATGFWGISFVVFVWAFMFGFIVALVTLLARIWRFISSKC